MANDPTPADDEPTDEEQPPEVEGTDVEYADPEPDEETGGDLIQLVRTGWVRFVIAGHGRVRLRPPRFGELRHISVAHEELVDAVQERSHSVQAVAEGLNAELEALPKDATPEARHELLASITLRSRTAGRELTRWREEQYLVLWRMIHAGDGERFKGLGVSGESLPDDDGMPLWLADPALVNAVLAHWRSVPLDRGKR